MKKKFALAIMLALLMTTPATTTQAADDNGKKFAEGAFQSLGTGGVVISFGAAAHATPDANDLLNSVRIFGYAGGPSEGQVYCGDVWNIIVTVDIAPPFLDRATVDQAFATQTLDGVLVGANRETAVRWSSTFGTLTQGHATFLPPGMLTDGTHVVSQTLEDPVYGIFWAPPPLIFEVGDSAC
jgi:hypothetical protein